MATRASSRSASRVNRSGECLPGARPQGSRFDGSFLSPLPTEQSVGRDAYRWQPERSRTGPLSIVVSGRDQRIVVMRNGVEIGSSAISIDGPVTTTEAFTFTGVDGERFHWLRLRLPGQPSGATELTIDERARGHMPEAFRRLLAASLAPGSTLLVTRESLRSGGTGKRLTLITTESSEHKPIGNAAE